MPTHGVLDRGERRLIIDFSNSMIGGGINTLKPPSVVRVHNLRSVPADVAEEVEYAVGSLARTRADVLSHQDRDVKVSFEIVA